MSIDVECGKCGAEYDARHGDCPACLTCHGCKRPTDDPVYIGRLRCCGRKFVVGRCCKPIVLEVFDTVGAYAKKFAKLHFVLCDGEPP